jgi:superfamily I DNA and/or RNA helicase
MPSCGPTYCYPKRILLLFKLRELVALQGQWLERLGRSDEFQAPLLAATNVVAGTCVGLAGFRALDEVEFDLCILDEASKATATETLVPLVRARRWVLVGDRNQLPPFQEEALKDPSVQQEYDLDPVELRTTLFDRLSLGLPEACSTMLRIQHRMVSAIGELISECFYRGALINEGPSPERLELALPTPVVWFTTSRLPEHSERPAGAGGLSYLNTTEAGQVLRFLGRLELAARSQSHRSSPLEVLVLSPYRPQVAEIYSRVSAAARDWPNLAVEVNSVDAAQGREADVVVFSVTRSNPSGKFGFLNEEARANVALSRGRLGLAIIGDSDFTSMKEGPLLKVLQHIKSHPESCSLVELEP